MENLSECKIGSGRKIQSHVPGDISGRNAGENELKPLVNLSFKLFHFKGHQDIFIFVSFFDVFPVSIYNGPRRTPRFFSITSIGIEKCPT